MPGKLPVDPLLKLLSAPHAVYCATLAKLTPPPSVGEMLLHEDWDGVCLSEIFSD